MGREEERSDLGSLFPLNVGILTPMANQVQGKEPIRSDARLILDENALADIID